MAQELQKYGDVAPLQVQTPADKSKNAEVMADIFGYVAKSAEQKIIEVKKEQEDVKLLTAQNHVYDIAKQGEAAIYAHPEMADKILQTASDSAKSAMKGFSGKAGAAMQNSFNQHIGQLGVQAAQITAKRDQKILQSQLYSTFPKQLDALNLTFDKSFESKLETLQKTNDDAFKGGIITADQHEKYSAQIVNVIDRHAAMHHMHQDPNTTAVQYNAITGISPTNNIGNIAGNPSDETTNHLMEMHTDEHTLASALGQATKAIYPDQETLATLKKHDFDTVYWQYMGANDAKAHVTSNSSEDYFQSRLIQLGADETKLTERQKGELAFIKNHLKERKEDFRATQDQSVEGAKIKNAVDMQTSMIDAIGYDTDAQKQSALNKILNFDINQRAALCKSQNIPSNECDIAPLETKQIIKDAFATPGAPVEQALNSIYKLDNHNQYWATKGLKPIQQSAVWTVALNRNALPDGAPYSNDMVDIMHAAQRKGANELTKEMNVPLAEDKKINMSKIDNYVRANMTGILNHVVNQPEGNITNGKQWTEGIAQLGVNYTLNMMEQHNDSDWSKYADEYVRIVNRGYDMYRGTNYSFNANEFQRQPITPQSARSVSFYMLNQWRERLTARYGEAKAIEYMDLNQTMVTNTRDQNIVLVDKNGNVLESHPYDSKFVSLTIRHQRQNQYEIERVRNEKEQGNKYLTRLGY